MRRCPTGMTRLKTRGGKESFVSRLPSGDGIRSHLCTHSDQARPYAKPLEDFYNRITDLVSEMQQRRVVRKATISVRDEIVVVHDKVWNSFYKNLRSPSGSISKGLDKMKKAWAAVHGHPWHR